MVVELKLNISKREEIFAKKRSQKKENCKIRRRKKKSQNVDAATKKYANTYVQAGKKTNIRVLERKGSSLGRYVFGSEISYNKPPPRLPGLGC